MSFKFENPCEFIFETNYGTNQETRWVPTILVKETTRGQNSHARLQFNIPFVIASCQYVITFCQ
jgi:hypothetical protein